MDRRPQRRLFPRHRQTLFILNQLLLRESGEYLTFKQAQEAGGTVRKGEKPRIVVFWKPLPVTEKDKEGKTVTKIIPMLRYYHVFHIRSAMAWSPGSPRRT